MKVSDAFPSRFIRETDLQGQTVKLTIDHVEMDMIGGDQKPVAYFKGKKKGLVLNVTKARAIETLAGEDMSTWGGVSIELFPTMVSFQGRPVSAIGVRPLDPVRTKKEAPATTPAPIDSDPDDPIDL